MPRIHPQLPYEVIQSELLPILPAKSIGRFRCVCKAWNSFLSTPHFARTHLPYQTNHKLLLLDHWRSPTFRTLDCEPPNHDSITTHPIPFTDNVCILASLDGLVCVALFKTQELPEFAFWNPLTGAYKKFHTSVLNTISGAFAFYKDSSNDYKLLHIASEGAFIYSRRLGSWRKIINPSLETIYHVTKFPWSHATFFAAKVYFMLGNKSVEGERRLISFDVESEKFKEIQFPRVPCGACLGASLVALNGCIHLCVACKNISGGSFDMCKMDGDGWIKVATYTRAQCNPVRLREIHTTKSANWLAICEDNINSFKNIDIEDFVTDLIIIKECVGPMNMEERYTLRLSCRQITNSSED